MECSSLCQNMEFNCTSETAITLYTPPNRIKYHHRTSRARTNTGPSPSADVSVLYMITEQKPNATRHAVHARIRCSEGARLTTKKQKGTTKYGANDAIRRESYASVESSVTEPRRLNSSRMSGGGGAI